MWDESDQSVLEGLHPLPNLEGLCIKKVMEVAGFQIG